MKKRKYYSTKNKRNKKRNRLFLTYKFRIYPTAEQQQKMNLWFFILRRNFRLLVDWLHYLYRKKKKDIYRTFDQFAKKYLLEHNPLCDLIPSEVIDWQVKEFRSQISKYIKPSSCISYRKYRSFVFPAIRYLDIHKRNSRFVDINFPMLGRIKTRFHRQLKCKTIVNVKFTKISKHWYIHILCSVKPSHKNNAVGSVGVDIGIKNLITTSDGKVFKPFVPDIRLLVKIKKLEKQLMRKSPGSSNYIKLKEKIMKLRCKIYNAEVDYYHKITASLVNKNKKILLEHLNIAEMGNRSSAIRQLIQRRRWHLLLHHIEYKSVRDNCQLVWVDPAYTTQLCSMCGAKVYKRLSDRIHICPFCGLEIDRDFNAAINIRQRGIFGNI
ncbi:MAG: hypothetical protein DRP85_00650 [Candidatus Makaraimicrobium thalassicum]|nr:MAG: hypothetical protein DRP85_00650 [Candidatus Omnitrophota bacterium]